MSHRAARRFPLARLLRRLPNPYAPPPDRSIDWDFRDAAVPDGVLRSVDVATERFGSWAGGILRGESRERTVVALGDARWIRRVCVHDGPPAVCAPCRNWQQLPRQALDLRADLVIVVHNHGSAVHSRRTEDWMRRPMGWDFCAVSELSRMLEIWRISTLGMVAAHGVAYEFFWWPAADQRQLSFGTIEGFDSMRYWIPRSASERRRRGIPDRSPWARRSSWPAVDSHGQVLEPRPPPPPRMLP